MNYILKEGKKQAIRHGDLTLVKVDSLPEGLTKSNTKTLMTGSHGNDHKINKGEVYFKNIGQFIIGYLMAKDTILEHPDHGEKTKSAIRKAKIEDGVYELRGQHEGTHEKMVAVID